MWETLNNLLAQNEILQAQLTPEVLRTLLQDLQTLTPTQQESKLQELLAKAQADADNAINALKDELNLLNTWAVSPSLDEDIEVQSDISYSIDGLIEHVSEDEKAKAFLELYKSVIANDLSTIYWEDYDTLNPSSKNTIELVFWNIIQSQLGARWAMNIGQWMLGSLTEWFTGLMWEPDESGTGSVLTRAFEGRQEMIEQIEGVPGVTDTLKEDISGMVDIVESLIWKQANNLETLLNVTSDNPQRTQIFDNPLIVEAVLNTGKYSENGFKIDITTSPAEINIWNNEDIATIQAQYMNSLKEDTSNLWGRLDRIKGLKDRADDFLEKVWLSGWMDELMETLYKIPVLGIFFQMIFGDFFEWFDTVQDLEAIDRILNGLGEIEAGISLKILNDSFIPEFATNYPNQQATALWKLIAANGRFSAEFYSGLTWQWNFFSIMEEAGITTTAPNFWDRVFMNKAQTGSPEALIHSKLAAIGLLWNGSITESAIQAALNWLDTQELKQIVTPNTPVPFDTSPSSNTDEVAPTDGETDHDTEIDPDFIGPMPQSTTTNAPVTEVSTEEAPTSDEVVPTDDTDVDAVIPPVEVTPTVVPLIDQISAISSLPTTLHIEWRWGLIISAFNNLNSTIELNGRAYTISLTGGTIIAWIETPQLPVTIQWFNIENGIWLLRVDGQGEAVEIESSNLVTMLEELMSEWNFVKEWVSDDGNPFTLSIR